MEKVYIIAAKRTAIGKMLGSLTGVAPATMAATVIKNILEETKIDPAKIDEVIVRHPHSRTKAGWRQAAVQARIPHHVRLMG